MPTNDAYIQSILVNFNVLLSEYEIIDLKEFQGWSTTHLYLIVSSDGEYILKAKTPEQIKGYQEEIIISDFLAKQKQLARHPILTTTKDLFVIKDKLFWCLLTYIPGAAAHLEEYNEKTIKSLSDKISNYINLSLDNQKFLENSQLPITDPKEIFDFEKVLQVKQKLLEYIPQEIEAFEYWNNAYKNKYISILGTHSSRSIIHNDINPKNILMDHATKEIIALIDWDHGLIGNPLKDISDTIGMFFDYLSPQIASEYEQIFINNLDNNILKGIAQEDLKVVNQAFYGLSKWKSVLFYLDLLEKYQDTYGEKERFIKEIKGFAKKWFDFVNR